MFTKEEWKVRKLYNGLGDEVWLVESDRFLIARVALGANAYLIAAAPQMYEACKLLLGTVDDFLPNIGHCVLQDYGRLNDGLIKGRQALAKAEGGRL